MYLHIRYTTVYSYIFSLVIYIAIIHTCSYWYIITHNILGYGPPMTGIGVDSSLAVSIIEIQPDGETRLELHCNIESKLTPDYVWTKEGSVYVKIKKLNEYV